MIPLLALVFLLLYPVTPRSFLLQQERRADASAAATSFPPSLHAGYALLQAAPLMPPCPSRCPQGLAGLPSTLPALRRGWSQRSPGGRQAGCRRGSGHPKGSARTSGCFPPPRTPG